MQAHEERYPGMIEQITQSQQQLVKLVNEAVHLEDVDSLEIDALKIAKYAFPGGHWPDDLHPWPTMRIQFAQILRACGRLMDALMQSVRGYLSLERRTGDIWIRHLSDLLQIILSVLVQSNWDTLCKNPVFPTEAQLSDILHGYLHELALGATKVFGVRAGYTQAIQAWYLECIESAGAPQPKTRAFAQRFKEAQSKLLLWAGVDENKGIVLA
jgi:SET and MYND domain-containing protein